ncbi:MAG: energy transducer TonB, partial [Flavobacteriales bacterium]
MKWKIPTLLFLLIAPLLLAKGSRKEHILDARTIKLNRIKVIPSKNKVFLPNKFGSHELKKLERLEKLKGRVVLGVDFVYTSYAEASSFDQRELNRKRLEELQEKLPRLVEEPTIEWRKVIQTGASSPEEGRDYFHGFRITLRPAPDKATLKKERKFLRETLSSKGGSSELMERCGISLHDMKGSSTKGTERKEGSIEETGAGKRKASKADSDTSSEIEDYTEASAEEIAGVGRKAKRTYFGTAPRFEGGRFKFFNYLSKQIFCPKKKALKEQGRIEMTKASFLVSPSGAILAPAVDKKDDPCADSIKSALRRMPHWEPGLHEGKPVLTQVILSLNFSKARPSAFIDTIERVTFSEIGGEKSPYYSASFMDTLHGGSFSYPFFSA